MRNRIYQPAPLDLPPVEVTPIRIYGQLIGPMQRPEAFVKILLKAITTNQLVVQDTWSECTADQAGNYDFSVNPGKYAVYFERSGIKTRVQNIQVYSDSAPGNLQSFMLSPAPELLTPLVVMEIKSALELATAAMLRARQWAENPVDDPVLDFEQGAGPEYSAYHWAHKAMEALDTDTNINWRGEWSSTAAYAFRDAVRWRPDANTAYSSYYCMEANTNHTPPTIDVGENEFWSLMAAGGTNGAKGADSEVPGPANQLAIGTVGAVPYGTPPSATITGVYPDQKLNLVLETGQKGDPGTPADMSNYYTKTEVTNLINDDLTNYYTKAEIDAMISGGGGIVDPGAVGSWALISTEDASVAYTMGQSISASELTFAMLYSVSPGPEWQTGTTGDKPAGTWRVVSDVTSSGYSFGRLFLAQRIA